MKVKVQITETLQRVIELDVPNEEVAIDIVTDQYNADELVLDASDYRDVEIEVVK